MLFKACLSMDYSILTVPNPICMPSNTCCLVVVIVVYTCSALPQRPEAIQLQDLRSSGIYSVIPADLPPQVPALRPGSVPLKEECTTIQNRNFQSGHHRADSSTSGRYGPAPDHTEHVTESNYAEIDGDRSERSRLRDRRPSDYEMVFVRDLGFVPTEDSHPLSPARSSQSSQKEEGEEGDSEQQMMKLLMSDLPPINPSFTNNYEIISNPHSKIDGNLPPDDLRGNAPSPSGIEVIKNASYGELPNTTARARALSAANNPMYSTIPTKTRDRELKEELRSTQHPDFVEYDVPPLESRQHRVSNQSNSTPGHGTYDSPSSREVPSFQGVNGTSNNPCYTYDVPPNNPREDTRTQGVNNYDIPSSNPREITRIQDDNLNYDVPQPITPAHHPTFVMVQILPSPRVQTAPEKPAYYKYDVPPSNLPDPKLDT